MKRLIGVCAVLFAGTATASGGGESLVEAVKADDVSAVRAMLDRGVDINARQADGATALAWSAVRGNAAMTVELLKAGADPNIANELGIGPLAIAIQHGGRDIVELLLAYGADPNLRRENGETPLMSAARLGQAAVVEMLLDSGAAPNARERRFGQTALMWAAGHPDSVRLLLDRGADPNPVTRSWDVKYVIYAPTTFTLGKTGIPWNTSGEYTSKKGGLNALFFAIQKGDMESVRALLDAGVDVNATTADGTSPLLASLYNWAPPDATFVPGRGAPAAAGASQHFAPNPEIARLLLDRGADPFAADGAGYTPLHGAALSVVWAVRAGDKGGSGAYRRAPALLSLNHRNAAPPSFTAGEAMAIVRRLLEGGADPNRQTLYPTPGPAGDVRINPAPPGSSAFHIAANSGSVDLVELLAEGGADPNLVRDDGHTPFSVSVVAGDLPSVKAMIASGADLAMRYDPDDKIPDPYEAITLARRRQTILHIAAATLEPEIVEYLASVGAPLDLENEHGETPLDLADHQERFRESLARQNAEGDPEKLAAVRRSVVTSSTLQRLLDRRTRPAP